LDTREREGTNHPRGAQEKLHREEEIVDLLFGVDGGKIERLEKIKIN
jgi:hypothetical protein